MAWIKHILNPQDFVPDNFLKLENKDYLVVLFINGPYDPISAEEFLKFSFYKKDFASIGCDVIGMSSHSSSSLKDWFNDLLSKTGLSDGIEIISDKNDTAMRDFGVLKVGQNGKYYSNALFIIDSNKTICYHNILSLNVTHSIEESLRLINAFKETDTNYLLAPADWKDKSSSIDNETVSIQSFYNLRYPLTRGVTYTGQETYDTDEFTKMIEKVLVEIKSGFTRKPLTDGKGEPNMDGISHIYHEDCNPVRIQQPHLTILDWIKLAFFAITLFPIRLVVFCLTMLLAIIMGNMAVIGMVQDKPASGCHLMLRKIAYIIIRILLACFGIYTIKQTGKKIPAADAPIIVAAPHTSYFDWLVVFGSYKTLPIVLMKESIAKVPLIGNICRFLQVLTVDRASKASKDAVIDEIKRKASSTEDWPKILIFPEGTITNGRSMLRFKKGGFLPIVPVEPVTIKYNNRLDTTNSIDYAGYKSFFFSMCQLITYAELEVLPTYTPSQDEKNDPELFMKNVQTMMSRSRRIPVCPVKTYRELINVNQ